VNKPQIEGIYRKILKQVRPEYFWAIYLLKIYCQVDS